MSNETSGEHYTPRDVVNLLVSLVFSGDKNHLEGEGILRSIFDPCCGTGGMLTIGKEGSGEYLRRCKVSIVWSGAKPSNLLHM